MNWNASRERGNVSREEGNSSREEGYARREEGNASREKGNVSREEGMLAGKKETLVLGRKKQRRILGIVNSNTVNFMFNLRDFHI